MSKKIDNENKQGSLSGKVLLVGIGYISTTIITILTTKLYANRYPFDEFSSILIFRLYNSVVLAIFALGMPISLQRTVAFVLETPSRAGTVALTGIWIGAISVGIACTGLALFSKEMAGYIGSPNVASLWRAIMLVTFTQGFATMVGLVQVARNRVKESNLLLFVSNGLSPLLAFLILPSASLATVVFWGGILTGIAAIPSFVEINNWALKNGIQRVKEESIVLFRYGLPRVIASVIEPLVDLSLPWFAIYIGAGLGDAGHLAVGINLLRPLNPLIGVLSIVLIPTTAGLTARNETELKKDRARRLLGVSFHLGVFGAVQMAVYSELFTKLWLGAQYIDNSPAVKILLLSMAPSFIYGSLRGMIDGESETPINTINLVMSIFIFFVCTLIVQSVYESITGIAIAYLVSKIYLGYGTVKYVLQSFRLNLIEAKIFLPTGISVAIGSLLLITKDLAYVQCKECIFLSLLIISSFLYVIALYYYRIEWVRKLIERLGGLWKAV